MPIPIELELKLGCIPATAAQLSDHLSQLCGQAPCIYLLKNTYFDTPENLLAQHRIALRIRQIDSLTLQTVKCAGSNTGGLSSRPEWETPYQGSFNFSHISQAEIRQVLTQARPLLQPTLTTDFQRAEWPLQQADFQLEFMLDQGSICANGQQEAICELEMEMRSGSTVQLFALAESLCSAHPLFPSPLSKAARGNRLRGWRPLPVEGLHGIFNAFCASLPANGGQHPEACHTLLAQLAPLLPRAEQDRLAVLMQSMGGALDPADPALGHWLLRVSQQLEGIPACI